MRTQPVPVASLTEEIVEDSGGEAEVRNIRIETQIHCSTVVEGDPELLRRALENVLRNAIRIAPAGSCVQVRVHDSNGRAKILVRYYVPCVSENMLGRIFDPFFRVHESRDRASGVV